MTDYAVELRNASKIYPARHEDSEDVIAVDLMNLEIPAGEFFTLLGPSGCGKTTTLRMIGGFELPTSGEVYIQGKNMTEIPPNHRPVNTVFQDYALFPHMNIAKNVAFGLTLKRVDRSEREKRVTEALQLVRMSGLEKRMPSQLSGGQQQRVALARALVNKPAVLLLDEPLGSLDLKLRKAMQLELKHLQHQIGITFIYVTHDQEEALTMSDRIAVMNQGKVLQIGDPLTIYEKPTSQFVADFIGETNFLNGTVENVQGDFVLTKVAGASCKVKTDEKQFYQGQQLILAVRPERIILSRVTKESSKVLSGTVQEVVYIGTDTRYAIGFTTGETITVRIANTSRKGRDKYDTGDRVDITWAEEDVRLFKTT